MKNAIISFVLAISTIATHEVIKPQILTLELPSSVIALIFIQHWALLSYLSWNFGYSLAVGVNKNDEVKS